MSTQRTSSAGTGGLTALYGRALVRQLPLVGARGGESLPDTVESAEVGISLDALRGYAEVCGFRLSDAAPPTYLHVPAFPLAMRLMTSGSFPFGVMGLVHVENRIEQRRAVRAGETVELRVRAEGLRPHDRGRQFDIVSAASVEGERIWLEHSTYLRREGGRGSSSRTSSSAASEPPRGGAIWRVPADAGRRYARVSGDRNPIHLHGLAARLFGQRRPIAHGMWLEARCLAALEGRVPEACSIDVRFKLPVFVGSKVAFTSRARGEEFELRSARDGRPHLVGTVAAAGGR
jgi:acyl dehydratase